MANHKSAIKRIRSSETKRKRNRYYSKTMRNKVKQFRLDTQKDEAVKELPSIVSMIDKLAKRSIIHKNKAANLKSKLTKKANAL